MALLFKGGEQLYSEAMDLVGRKDYSGAKKKFLDACEKGCEKKDLAAVYAALIDVGNNRANINYYRILLQKLGSLNAGAMKFGLTEFDQNALVNECQLVIEEIEACNISDSQYTEKSAKMIEVAGKFAMIIGERNLILDEIFKGNTVSTGTRESLILQAQAYSVLGKGSVASNPKMAAEYMQMAYTFRRQMGDSGEEELRLSQNFARSAKCWICGRPANAEGIHFRSVSADVEPVFRNMAKDDIVKPSSDDGHSIYICMPCFTAFNNMSDSISRHYYEQAMSEMRAMERRIQSEIALLRMTRR